jgi:hypothetical protein
MIPLCWSRHHDRLRTPFKQSHSFIRKERFRQTRHNLTLRPGRNPTSFFYSKMQIQQSSRWMKQWWRRSKMYQIWNVSGTTATATSRNPNLLHQVIVNEGKVQFVHSLHKSHHKKPLIHLSVPQHSEVAQRTQEPFYPLFRRSQKVKQKNFWFLALKFPNMKKKPQMTVINSSQSSSSCD